MKNRRRGSTLVLSTMAILMLLGSIGLVTDIGYSYYTFQQAQAAADAGAMAGTAYDQENTSGLTSSLAACSTFTVASSLKTACQYAETNGFSASEVSVAGGTGTPPGTTSGVSVNYWVQVQISRSIPQLFSYVLGNKTMTVKGNSVSGAWNSTPLIATGSSGSITATSSDQAHVCGNVKGKTVTATYVSTTCGGVITTGSQPTDPYASVVAPTKPATCAYGSTQTFTTGANVTLDPSNGAFCGGLTVTGTAIVKFNPGTYWVQGTVDLAGWGSVSGTGVTIYSADNFTVSMTCSGLVCGTLNLSAPTSGAYQNIVFFESRTSTAPSLVQYITNTTQNVTGAVYIPDATLDYYGGTSTSRVQTSIVASSVSFITGTSYLWSPSGSLIP